MQCNALNSRFHNVSVERREGQDESQTQTLGSGLVNPHAVESLTDLTLYSSPQCAQPHQPFSSFCTPSFFPWWSLGLKGSSPWILCRLCDIMTCNPLHITICLAHLFALYICLSVFFSPVSFFGAQFWTNTRFGFKSWLIFPFLWKLHCNSKKRNMLERGLYLKEGLWSHLSGKLESSF